MAEVELNTSLLHKYVDRLQAGDNNARNDLILATCCRLDKLARKMLREFPHVARWEQAEDVLQNALLRLMKTLEAIKPESTRAFFGLAAQAIRRELLDLLDRYRCQKRAMEAHHDSHFHRAGSAAVDSSVNSMDPADPNVEQPGLDRWAEFHEAVAQLPGEEGEVFQLLFYNGLTQQEAAHLRGVSEKTIHRRWQRACAQLRARFGDGLILA